MRYKVFSIPVLDPGAAEQELNTFLGSHRIVSVEKALVQSSENAWWSFVVTWQEGSGGASAPRKPTVDYREVLDDEDFARYAQLRELRNRLAKKEGKPAYAIFTNEQLAALVTQRVTSKKAMAAINGIGESRIERYGEAFLELLRGFDREQDR